MAEMVEGRKPDFPGRLGDCHPVLNKTPEGPDLQGLYGQRTTGFHRIQRNIAFPVQSALLGEGCINFVNAMMFGQRGKIVEFQIQVIGAVDDGGFLALVLERDLALRQHDPLQDQLGGRLIFRRWFLGRIIRQAFADSGHVEHAFLVLNQTDARSLQPQLGEGGRAIEQGAQQFKIHMQPFQRNNGLLVGFGQHGVLDVQPEQEWIERHFPEAQGTLDPLGDLLRHVMPDQGGHGKKPEQGIGR